MWVRPAALALILIVLLLLSCQDESYLVGFKNPSRDFKVFYKEFTIPTKVVQIDSLVTNNGGSTDFRRVMVGQMNDSKFGKTTAIAYSQMFPQEFTVPAADATVTSTMLTLVLDFYYVGAQTETNHVFTVHELTDSLKPYEFHYFNSSVPYEATPLGTTTKLISSTAFEQNIKDNTDTDSSNDLIDSLNVELGVNFGTRLIQLARDTAGANEQKWQNINKFTKIFKGLALKTSTADKIIRFDPTHAKSRITITYTEGGVTKYMHLLFTTINTVNFTQFITDRSGTPLSGLTSPYKPIEPPDNNRYIQSGTGVLSVLDFSEVYNHFKDIPVKALSAAELHLGTVEQPYAPTNFLLRAAKPNYRNLVFTTIATDPAGDSYTTTDLSQAVKHTCYSTSLPRMEILADDAKDIFLLSRVSDPGTGVGTYSGFLASFLQRELTLPEADQLKYFSIVPSSPVFNKSVNGFYFPKDSLKLKIYYTVPTLTE